MKPDEPHPEWLTFMLKEYEYHRTGIDKFDAQRLQIRGWAITVTGAFLAFAVSSHEAIIAIGSIIATLFFFFLESIYMSMQHDVMTRSNYLEELINHYRTSGTLRESYSFGVSYAYRGNFFLRDIRRLIFRRGRLHITAFYFGLLVVSILGSTLTLFIR